jgi:hypothetical protein
LQGLKNLDGLFKGLPSFKFSQKHPLHHSYCSLTLMEYQACSLFIRLLKIFLLQSAVPSELKAEEQRNFILLLEDIPRKAYYLPGIEAITKVEDLSTTIQPRASLLCLMPTVRKGLTRKCYLFLAHQGLPSFLTIITKKIASPLLKNK